MPAPYAHNALPALPLLCVLVGVVWTMGVMGWLGEPISLGTLVLPSLLGVAFFGPMPVDGKLMDALNERGKALFGTAI